MNEPRKIYDKMALRISSDSYAQVFLPRRDMNATAMAKAGPLIETIVDFVFKFFRQTGIPMSGRNPLIRYTPLRNVGVQHVEVCVPHFELA